MRIEAFVFCKRVMYLHMGHNFAVICQLLAPFGVIDTDISLNTFHEYMSDKGKTVNIQGFTCEATFIWTSIMKFHLLFTDGQHL